MMRLIWRRAFRRPLVLAAGGAVVGLALAGPSPVLGQAKPTDQAQPADHSKHDHQHQAAAQPTEAGDPFADQVRQLRDKVAALEAALSQGQGAGQPSPMGRGQGVVTGASVGWKVPAGYHISAQYADCLRCHQTIPSGPMPPNHLEKAGGMGMGMMEGGGQGGPGRPGATPTTSNESPVEQFRELRDKIAALEAALSQGQGLGQSRPMSRGEGMGMGTMGGGQRMGRGGSGTGMMGGGMGRGGQGMGMMDGEGMMGGEMGPGMMGQGGMGGRQGMGMMGGGMSMMDDMDGMGMGGTGKGMGMTGMGAMGRARGMAGMAMGSALPGFPGISHLYHIGAEGFFLNHVEHITLSADQRKKLNRIKEKALLGGSSCDRKVEEAEQDLWELTSSDAPDAAAIEAKVREIEKLRGDQRLAFIHAVGEAAKVLTDDQRRALAGTAAEASSRPTTAKP
jgi:Spy/CpxP family protein refolding chaperone